MTERIDQYGVDEIHERRAERAHVGLEPRGPEISSVLTDSIGGVGPAPGTLHP